MRLVLLAGLFVAGAVAQAAPASSLQQKLRGQVAATLKDPYSAHFQHEFLWGKPEKYGPKALCGEVNAKNSYGGYSGYKRFISIVNGNAVIDGEDHPDFHSLWNRWCVNPLGPLDASNDPPVVDWPPVPSILSGQAPASSASSP